MEGGADPDDAGEVDALDQLPLAVRADRGHDLFIGGSFITYAGGVIRQ